MPERLRERVRDAAARGLPLRLRGGGSKDFYGGAPRGEVLDTRGHAGIVAYEPSELVVTARCGTPLAELEAALAAQGQMLAFEPPRFGGAATLGGCVAAGLSGPRRAAAGAVRDFVLGARIIDGSARELAFGGQVMKNVAGYDVSRLLAGSLGTLGLILEVSLKVLPRPAAERTLRLELPQDTAVESLNRWAGLPLPLSASAWRDGELCVRLSGAERAVQAAAHKLGGEALESAHAERFWSGIREQSDPYFAGDAPLWRLSMPSAAAPLELAGELLVEWGGALRWLRSAADAATVRAAAARAGGHATLFRGGDKAAGVFAPLAPALLRLHRELKAAFDPAGVFNPGRLHPDF
jgi:glycolate dehydrogenase FAD-binding subunit